MLKRNTKVRFAPKKKRTYDPRTEVGQRGIVDEDQTDPKKVKIWWINGDGYGVHSEYVHPGDINVITDFG